MIFRLHKTLSLLASLRAYGSRPFRNDSLLFSDSGTSSFAALIESLKLHNTTMILPAYICNSFASVLRTYGITPIFVDADERTGHISVSHLEQILKTHTDIKSALLCPIYGTSLDTRIQKLLGSHEIPLIYDLSHCYQNIMQLLCGQSQYQYAFASLSKTLPVLNGGIAISIDKHAIKQRESYAFSCFTRIKKELQLLKLPGFLLYAIRITGKYNYELPLFLGIRTLSKRNRQLLHWHMTHTDTDTPYVHAFLVHNPDEVVRNLVKRGIEARRIWSDPLIGAYEDDLSKFPITKKLAEQVVCVPAATTSTYLQRLKHALKNYQAEWLNEPEW